MKIFLKAFVLIFGLIFAATLSFAAEIKIGVAEALTGPIAKYGVPIRNGFTLAAEEINGAGGINGNKINLIIEDEQGEKEEAINVFKKFIFKDKVLAIFGPTLSNSAFAADPVANENKTVVFGTSNTAEGITAIGPYVFRNSIAEADILPVVVKVAKNKLGLKKVAIMYGNDDSFTKSGYDAFKKAVDAEGLQVVATETFAKGDMDYSAQLTKIKSLEPDAIVCSALVEEAANIVLQARKLGIPESVHFIGGNGFNSTKLGEIAGKAAEGVISGSPWFLADPNAKNQAFVKAYKTKFGSDPDQFAAQAYDALYIMSEALKKIKLTGNIDNDRGVLRDELAKIRKKGKEVSLNFKNDKGKPTYGYAKTNKYGWVTAIQQEDEEAFEQVKRNQVFALSIFGFTVIIVSLIALLSARTIVKPITQMTNAAERMSMGDLEVKIDIKSKDEIGLLAQAINRMQTSLNMAMERMRRKR